MSEDLLYAIIIIIIIIVVVREYRSSIDTVDVGLIVVVVVF